MVRHSIEFQEMPVLRAHSRKIKKNRKKGIPYYSADCNSHYNTTSLIWEFDNSPCGQVREISQKNIDKSKHLIWAYKSNKIILKYS